MKVYGILCKCFSMGTLQNLKDMNCNFGGSFGFWQLILLIHQIWRENARLEIISMGTLQNLKDMNCDFSGSFGI